MTVTELLTRAQDFLTAIEAENRDLTDDEIREYDTMLATIERRQRVEVITRGVAAGTITTEGPASPGVQHLERSDPWAVETQGQVSRSEIRGAALTAVERSIGGVPDAAKESTVRALESDPDPESRLARYVIESSRSDYLHAFTKWMRDPERGHMEWTPAERDAFARVQTMTRAMSLGTTTAGGFLAPYALDPQILISGVGSVDPMRDVSSVQITALNEQRFVTSLGVTASWDAEAAAVSDDSPALLQPAITSYKGAAFIPLSIELFEDTTIAQQVGTLFADSKAQLEANAFTLGSGSQPKGVITAIAAVGGSVVTSAGAALALVDLIANQNALPARWRPRAKFMANLSQINAARQLPMYANGPSVVNDSTNPPRALGWELIENSNIDGTIAAGTTNDYVWLSGDFSQYKITDRIGTSVEYVPHLFDQATGRPSGSRGFYCHWRTGGDVLIPDAFRLTNYSG